jgi:hypothetical protein
MATDGRSATVESDRESVDGRSWTEDPSDSRKRSGTEVNRRGWQVNPAINVPPDLLAYQLGRTPSDLGP